MPYKIMKMGGQYCVYKKDGNMKMGCSDSLQKAKDQIAAIYANEGTKKSLDDIEFIDQDAVEAQKMIMRPSQAEASYVTLSSNAGQACANCRWFNGDEDYCGIIENYPEDVLPTGYCNRWEAKPNAPQTEMPMMGQDMTGPDMGAESDMMQMSLPDDDHQHEQPDIAYIAPDSNSDSVFKAITDKFKRGLKPGLSVIKGADGERLMLIVTSNSYQDREGETITTDALKSDVDKAWDSVEDQFASDNKLLFWHDDRVELGDIVWADMRGPFLVELAKENHAPLSAHFFDYREAHPDEKWGASHRFAYLKAHKDEDGTYHHIHKRETSILPREAAANALTFSGVIPMTSKRDAFLNKMLGLDNAAELLDKGIETLVAELEKRGVEHKSTDSKPAETVSPFGNLLADMIKAQAEMSEQLDAVKATADKATADNAALVEANKALTDRLAMAEKQLDARPRQATRAPETEVEADKIAADVRKSLTKKDPFFKVEVRE